MLIKAWWLRLIIITVCLVMVAALLKCS